MAPEFDLTDPQALQAQTEAARWEWEAAESQFANAVEPDQVDSAIYAIDAARKRYRESFRQLRQSYGLPVVEEE